MEDPRQSLLHNDILVVVVGAIQRRVAGRKRSRAGEQLGAKEANAGGASGHCSRVANASRSMHFTHTAAASLDRSALTSRLICS